jgi:colanic acid biosynthesis protein WcaH
MLDSSTFKTIVKHTPLVSIDLIVKKDNKVLLGKRLNKPAIGYYFTPGGRIFKNEKMKDAIARIAKEELGISSKVDVDFIGVFEHLYDDSIFEGISTHYINLAYELNVNTHTSLPYDQHDDYIWISIEELMNRNDVHDNVKLYFKKDK